MEEGICLYDRGDNGRGGGGALVQPFVQGRHRRGEKRYSILVFTGAATGKRKVEGTGAA